MQPTYVCERSQLDPGQGPSTASSAENLERARRARVAPFHFGFAHSGLASSRVLLAMHLIPRPLNNVGLGWTSETLATEPDVPAEQQRSEKLQMPEIEPTMPAEQQRSEPMRTPR